MPCWRSASGGGVAAPGEFQPPGLGSTGNRHVARDGSGHARGFNLRAGPDRRQRAGICDAAMESVLVSRSDPYTSQPLDAPQPTIPLPRGPVPQEPPERELRAIEVKIDGKPVSVAEGS